MKKKTDKSNGSGGSRVPGSDEDVTVIVGNYPAEGAAGKAVAEDDGSAEDKTLLAGECVDGDKTILAGNLVGDDKTLVSGGFADDSDKTLMPGDRPADGATPESSHTSNTSGILSISLPHLHLNLTSSIPGR